MALALGRTHRELKRDVWPREAAYWQAYWQLEPWGAHRDNWHTAALLDVYLKSKTPREKHGSLPAMSDYFYEHKSDRAAREQQEKETRHHAAGQFLREKLIAHMAAQRQAKTE